MIAMSMLFPLKNCPANLFTPQIFKVNYIYIKNLSISYKFALSLF